MNHQEPSIGKIVRWPLIVAGLLVGHVTLMLVAVMLSIIGASPALPHSDEAPASNLLANTPGQVQESGR